MVWWVIGIREVDEVDTFRGPPPVLYRPGDDIGEPYVTKYKQISLLTVPLIHIFIQCSVLKQVSLCVFDIVFVLS